MGTFQSPAANASIPMLVPDDKLQRANGLLQLRDGAQSIVSPVRYRIDICPFRLLVNDIFIPDAGKNDKKLSWKS
jgi:hypothetical protein